MGRLIDRVFDTRSNVIPIQQPQRVQYPGSSVKVSHIVEMPWPKLQYALWIEGVKRKYAQGGLVTMLHIPVIPNAVPMKWEIVDINELHRECKYDTDVREPICITVRYPSGVVAQKCPATLRNFTKEELQLVELSNKKPEGTA